MSDLFWSAAALALIFEGLLPFMSPPRWRAVFERATRLSDAQIRLVGLSCLVIGLLVLLVFQG